VANSLCTTSLLAASFGVGAIGYRVGQRAFGLSTAIGGAVIGFYLGGIPVRLFTELSLQSLIRKLARTDTPTLRGKLRSEYYLSHFIVGVLMARGESEKELQQYSLRLLVSSSDDERWHAWRTLNMCFPEMAATLKGINPLRLSDSDMSRIGQLLESKAVAPTG
jgi:hypothetical protein